MKPYSPDTDPKTEKVWLEMLRAAPPAKKCAMITALHQAAEELALAGLRRRYPHADERELKLRLGALRLGRETMIRVFHWDPEKEGW